jgi:hypothetical protein
LWKFFRHRLGTFVGAFLANIIIATSRYAEICVVIYVILNLLMLEVVQIFGLNVIPSSWSKLLHM